MMAEETTITEYQKIPLFDKDLQNPLHDQILLWLDEQAEEIINQFVYPGLSAEQIAEYSSHAPEIKKTWQQPIKSAAEEVIGFVDLAVRYEREGDPDDDIIKVFLFDVRTKIESLGALLREINLYKDGLGFERSWLYTYLVVSPDDRYAEILKTQNVYFLPYQP